VMRLHDRGSKTQTVGDTYVKVEQLQPRTRYRQSAELFELNSVF